MIHVWSRSPATVLDLFALHGKRAASDDQDKKKRGKVRVEARIEQEKNEKENLRRGRE